MDHSWKRGCFYRGPRRECATGMAKNISQMVLKKVSNQEYALISQHGNGSRSPAWPGPAIKKLTRKLRVQLKKDIPE
jgi:hypothetical protein